MTTVDLSITIATYNTRELICQCVESIYKSANRISFEICVVDNCSQDGTANLLNAQFPGVRVIRNTSNVGVAAATNQGIAVSEGRYFLTLNSDTVVSPTALDTLVEFMEMHPEAGAATARLVRPGGKDHPPVCGNPVTLKWALLEALSPLGGSIRDAARRERVGDFSNLPCTQEVPCIRWGTALIVRRKVIDMVGGQDTQFFVYGEDVDWSMRIAASGWKLYYVAEAEVIHHGGRSTDQDSERMNSQLIKSRCWLVSKHCGILAGWLHKLAVALISMTRLARWVISYITKPSLRDKSSARIREMWSVVRAVLT